MDLGGVLPLRFSRSKILCSKGAVRNAMSLLRVDSHWKCNVAAVCLPAQRIHPEHSMFMGRTLQPHSNTAPPKLLDITNPRKSDADSSIPINHLSRGVLSIIPGPTTAGQLNPRCPAMPGGSAARVHRLMTVIPAARGRPPP